MMALLCFVSESEGLHEVIKKMLFTGVGNESRRVQTHHLVHSMLLAWSPMLPKSATGEVASCGNGIELRSSSPGFARY